MLKSTKNKNYFFFSTDKAPDVIYSFTQQMETSCLDVSCLKNLCVKVKMLTGKAQFN